jgi:hypothetical protein
MKCPACRGWGRKPLRFNAFQAFTGSTDTPINRLYVLFFVVGGVGIVLVGFVNSKFPGIAKAVGVYASLGPSASTNSVSPTSIVRQYYALWNSGDYRTMYGMLSSKMHAHWDYASYARTHAAVHDFTINASDDGPTAVRFDLASTQLGDHNLPVRSRFTGTWQLVSEDGSLKCRRRDKVDPVPPG